MEMFNAEIKPGMLALIIGVNQPCNSHMIGSIVTVEYVYAEGDDLSHLFEPPCDFQCGTTLAHISGCTETSAHFGSSMQEGHCLIQPKYLMPLPPLRELERQKEKELERV